MKLFRNIIYLLLFLFGVYAAVMAFLPKNKTFTITRDVPFPMAKLYPQFRNLQNYSQWYQLSEDEKNLAFTYFTPYEGPDSWLHFVDKKDSARNGDLFIRYENPGKALRYQLFERRAPKPLVIDVRFMPKGNQTAVTWFVRTPETPFLKRFVNLRKEDNFSQNIDVSLQTLKTVLGNKVEKEAKLNAIKYDTIMTETLPVRILLGINVSSSNKKGEFAKSVELSHNKLLAFLTHDLDKKEDEFGDPELIFDAQSIRSKDISYFYGAGMNKKFGVTDNNFSFRTLSSSQALVCYIKGNFDEIARAEKQLERSAQQQNLQPGELSVTFISPPSDDDNIAKVALQVH